MKKFGLILCSISIFLALVFTAGFAGFNDFYPAYNNKVYADEPIYITQNSEGMSGNLFSVLLRIYNQQTSNNTYRIPADYFNSFTSLDLSGTGNSQFSYINDYSVKIDNLGGLQLFVLSNVETLKVNHQQISTVLSTDLSSLYGLKNLYLNNNKITSIALPTSLGSINYVDFSHNNLTNCTLTNLAIDNVTLPSANLSFNKIAKREDIVLPRDKNVAGIKLQSLDVSYNLLTDSTPLDFCDDEGACNTVALNVQGIAPSTNYQTKTLGDTIKVFNNITAKTFYSSNSSYASITTEITSSNLEGVLTIPAGKIDIVFYVSNVRQTEGEFAPIKIYSKLPTPVFKTLVDGEETTNYNQGKNFSIEVLNGVEGIDFQTSLLTSNTIEFSVNDADVDGALFDITQNGTYSLSAKNLFDGIYSDFVTISITKGDMMALTILIIVAACLISLVIAGIVIFTWYKNGAVVAPLNDKEITRLERSRGNFVADKKVDDDDFIRSKKGKDLLPRK